MAQKRSVVKASHARTMLSARNLELLPWYDQEFLRMTAELGGIYNAHAHLDRAETLEEVYLRHIGTTPLEASNLPLSVKQNLVGDLHKGIAYTEENLRKRMRGAIEKQIAFGVTRLDTNIDATPDLPENGLLAIRVACELKDEYAAHIKIRIAPTPIFGFKRDSKDKISRWEVFKEAADMCDYLSLLPEKDDFNGDADRDGKVGFKPHVRMGLELGLALGKEVQFHLDQMNVPNERGTWRMLEVLEAFETFYSHRSVEPRVWVIHMISPSAYSEPEYAELLRQLRRLNVGVVACPSAALSMRQLRSIESPTHNSIARIPELVKAKIPLRLGTDNIADVFVPQSDGDMLTEMKLAGSALRMNSPSIWAKLAAGVQPNNVDITTAGRILYEDRKACVAVGPTGWKPAIE